MLDLYWVGATDAQVALRLGVTDRTINNWKKKHPEFFQSIKAEKREADALVEQALFHRARGYSHAEERVTVTGFGKVVRVPTVKHYPPDTVAGIFWLTNRQPDRWKRSRAMEEPPSPGSTPIVHATRTFVEFCAAADYPAPYQKQEEMRSFVMDDAEGVPRLLLGARGYGKTDYITLLGVAYRIYMDRQYTVLILTKSKERNVAILNEIQKALEKNGVTFEKANSNQLRVTGLRGKDHSVSATTIRTASLRGRHPDLVIMDDPVTEDDTSEATRKLVEKKWNEILKLTSNAAVIGQPAHKFDLYAKLRGLVKTMEVPYGSIPELDHDLEAQRLAGVSEESIQASYFLTIKNEGTTPFTGLKYLDKFPAVQSSVAFIDPSHEGGDFTAVTIAASYFDGLAVVGFTWKKAWNHCLDEIVARLQQFNVRRVAFETNALGDQPIIMLQELLKDTSIGVVGRRTVSNKHARILAAGGYSHLIHLCRESGKAYTDQVEQYEYNAKNDDAPDSLASLLEWVGLLRIKT